MKPVKIKPRWWRKSDDGRTADCGLCFHACRIPDGGVGRCGARWHRFGTLSSPYLGRFSSVAIDPIEKKPLYHWRPGSFILSLGSVGCNMYCPFCQNHGIAQPARVPHLEEIPPEGLLAYARKANTNAVAYTYNEPTLQAEYILEAAPLLNDAGIATVLVTNGMISPEALADLLPWIAAANVDVKTFDAATYEKIGGSLDAARATVARMHASGVHVEITNLVVPGISDSHEDFEKMVDWIASLPPNGEEIPLHISRYFPAHKYAAPATDVALMRAFQAVAEKKLSHVHLGNV